MASQWPQGLRIYFEPDPISLTSALIGASNFFELAVATALATVVGVLIEVPVMLSVVYLVKRSKGWYEKA
jgi:ACR3 family arsenite transporter